MSSVFRSEITLEEETGSWVKNRKWKVVLVPRLAFVLWFLLHCTQGMGHQVCEV